MFTLIYFYITIFTIYFVILSCVSLKKNRKIRDKYTLHDSNICVIVYATGEVPMLENLVKQLKAQNYEHKRYTIYVILDKVENPPEFIFQTDLDINLVNINNMEPIGKSQAYSIIAEKLSEVPNLDAYLFLDAKHYVDSDLLENVNYYLTKHDVFIPEINYIGEYGELKFWDCVRVTYSKYVSKFINNSRTKLGLSNLINTDAFVIKHNILNEVGSFDFRDKTSEMQYTFKLANLGYPCALINDFKVYKSVSDFDLRIPSLSKRVSLFWSNFTSCKTAKAFEYITSQISPNILVILAVYLFFLSHTSKFSFIVSYTTVLISAITLSLAFCISLLNAKIYAKEYLYLFMYPFYSLAHVIKHFPPVRFIRNLANPKNRKHAVEKMMTEVVVTDGTNDYNCKIELISDNGLAKVKFINRGKSYMTKNNHLRMVDAIRELSQKMEDYGLSLKACQNCKYFQPIVDGSTNMVTGCCKCQFEGRVEGDTIPTLIWNTCPKFEKVNVVSLF